MTQLDRRDFIERTASSVALLSLLSPHALGARLANAAGLDCAIIGMGRQGRAVAAQLQKFDGVRIAALCDIDERRLSSGKRRVGEVETYADTDALFGSATPINAVFVCTPTPTHKQIALQSIDAGKHVYCEAPLANTREDCLAIAQAARTASTVVQGGLGARSNPVYQLARTFYRSDSVRDLVSMRAQDNKKTSWRTPGGNPQRDKLLNWRLDPATSIGLAGERGVHQFDVFNWYTNSYPTSVGGVGAIRLHDDGRTVDDTIAATLVYPGDTALQYEATLANSYGGKYEVLFGTNAAIKLAWTHGWMFKEADAPTQGWEVYANRQQFHNDEGITLIADATQLASQGKLKDGVGLPHPTLYYALADFLRSVTEGAPVVCTADEAARATIIAIETNRAITSGERIEITAQTLGNS